MPPNQAQKAPVRGGDAPPPVPHEGTSQSGVPKLVDVSGFQKVFGIPPVSKPPSTINWAVGAPGTGARLIGIVCRVRAAGSVVVCIEALAFNDTIINAIAARITASLKFRRYMERLINFFPPWFCGT